MPPTQHFVGASGSENGGMTNNNNNPFEAPLPPTTSHDHHGRSESHYSSEARTQPLELNPFLTLESTQNQQQVDATTSKNFSVTEQGPQSKASGNNNSPFSPTQNPMHNNSSSNAAATTKAPKKRGKDVRFASESSDDDIPASSFPRHGQQGSDGSERQNPQLQVMERPDNISTTSSNYRFPSHVFDRHKSNTQWSTASNESLFSIQMGNTSFSDMTWMISKSDDMDRPAGETLNSLSVAAASISPSNQPPLPPQPHLPATKFNDISQSTAKQHEGSRVTEEKAAETMREVIMENSIRRESVGQEDLIGGAPSSTGRSTSYAHSQQSDGSTKSYAFKVMTDGEKPVSSKHDEEKRKQQKQPEQHNIKPTSDAAAEALAQTPRPTPKPPQNKSWLSCFSCC